MLDGLFPVRERKTLRPHQLKALEMLRGAMKPKEGIRKIVVAMPTGAGKTLTASRIIEGALAKGSSVIFTAPMISLIDQTVQAFEDEGIRGIGVMQANHPRTDSHARVQVASVQTLAVRQIPQAALVIVDECHVRAAVIERLMKERPDVFFVGLSATPWAQGMGLVWQGLVTPCTVASLIDAGLLSRFSLYAPDVPDLSGVKVARGEYVEGQLAEIMGEAKLVGNVVENWLARAENRPTLVFGVNRNHARHLHAQFERAGVASAYVDGESDGVERNVIGRRFRDGEVRVICSVRTMTTGVDLPVSCIVDAAPTKSEMLHLQKLGRGLRVNPGTEDLVVFDHAGNALRLGLPTDIHHDALDATPKGKRPPSKPAAEKLPKPCSKCEVLFTGKLCPSCGHERAPAPVDAAEGELVEITGKRAPVPMAVKLQWLAMLLWMAKSRGYKAGWASQQYKQRFGCWPPNGVHPMPVQPSPEVANWVKSRQIAYARRRAAQ